MQPMPTGTVTFLFTDIEGSTRLWEDHPGAMRSALKRHDALLGAAVAEHEGIVVKSRGEGDSLFAVFGRATDAVAAACAAQRAICAEGWATPDPIRVRMALHIGEADLRDGDYYGPAVNRCARLRAITHGGQILLSEVMAGLTRSALPGGATLQSQGSHRLKDLAAPEQVFQLLHPELPSNFPPLRSLNTMPNNLPVQLTRFIGREKEMEEVRRLLGAVRLVTLTGSGGSGKSRLSVQVGADLVDQFEHGVWLIELAGIQEGALVPNVTAAALNLREEAGRPLVATLTDYLRSRRALLILDNCEHLVQSCAQLADTLLRACPDLRILATSREALGISGETSWRVPSLSLPDPNRLPPIETLTVYESVKLFIDRAVAASSGFAVTNQNAPALVQICQRLDGIPLAIELAAARVKGLTVEQIAQRLNDRFRLLTGGSRTALPRQQTLRALVDWSHDLLSERERALWRRLSVFVGGFILEAAEQVCSGDPIEDFEVLDSLLVLVDKSLVVAEESGSETRYRLLETVRQYGRDRLLESGEMAVLRDRHRDWFAQVGEQAAPELLSRGLLNWVQRLGPELDNLRSALEWCQETDPVGGLRLIVALHRLWVIKGYAGEGRTWTESLLNAATDVPAPLKARALLAAAQLAVTQNDFAAAKAVGDESRSLFLEQGDKAGAGMAMVWYIWAVIWGDGDISRSMRLIEELMAFAASAGDRRVLAHGNDLMARATQMQGHTEEALKLSTEALQLFKSLGDHLAMANTVMFFGHATALRGDFGAALPLARESHSFFRAIGDRSSAAAMLQLLASSAFRQGQFEEARALATEGIGLAREVQANTTAFNLLGVLWQLAVQEGDIDKAEAITEEARVLDARALLQGWYTHMAARVAWERGDLALSHHLLLEYLELARKRDDSYAMGHVLARVGQVLRGMGRLDDAQVMLGQALEHLTENFTRGFGLRNLGHVVRRKGDLARAESLYREALAFHRGTGARAGQALGLGALAALAFDRGQTERGVRLAAATMHVYKPMREEMAPDEYAELQAMLAAAARTLSEAEYAAARDDGAAMSPEQALAYALEGGE